MKEVLLTLGDSFTWGEGLDSELMLEMFPDTSKLFFESQASMDSIYPMHQKVKLTNSVPQLTQRRIESTYGYLLNEKLGTTHISNGVNGGSNVERLMDLDYFIHLFQSSTDIKPTHCVIQLTDVGRDILWILEDWKREDITKFIPDVYPKEYMEMIKYSNVSNWVELDVYNQALMYIIGSFQTRFKQMETLWGTNCKFFIGLGDVNFSKRRYVTETLTSIKEELNSNPYFIPMIWNGREYTTFSEIAILNNLTIRNVIGFNDDHAHNILHKWLSEYLYLKLTNRI